MNRSIFCSMLGATTLAGAMTRPAAATGDVVRFGSLSTDTSLEMQYGADQPFAQQSGLAPKYTTMNNGAAMLAALVGGSLDVININVISMFQAYAKGVPITMIGSGGLYLSSAPPEVLMVAKDSPLRTARDLQGKVVAVDGLRNITQLSVMAWMDKNGADSSTVKWAELPFAEMPAGLSAHRFEAALMVEPFATQAKSDARVFAQTYDAIANRFLVSSWVAMKPWVSANPDLARRVSTTISKTAAWVDKNQKRTAQILQTYTHVSPDVIAAMPRAFFLEKNDLATMKPIIDVAVKYGVLPASISAADIWAPEIPR